MRYLAALLALVLALFDDSAAAALDAAARAECVGGVHVVSVAGQYREEYGGEIYDGEISGLVLKCEAIGVCEPSFFYPETPLTLDPQPYGGGWFTYQAECSVSPPLANVAYRYTPFGVRPDGTLVPTVHHCAADSRSYDFIGCEDTPVARGVLEVDSSYDGEVRFRIDICAANCWTENFWTYLDIPRVEELSGQPWRNLLGQVLDLFGSRTYCSAPGGARYELTRVALAPNGDCGPAPIENTTWGSLKGTYR